MPENFRIIVRKTQPLEYNDVLSYLRTNANPRNPRWQIKLINSADNFNGTMYFNMEDIGAYDTTTWQRLQYLVNGLKDKIKTDDQRYILQMRRWIQREFREEIDRANIQLNEDQEDTVPDAFMDSSLVNGSVGIIWSLIHHPETKQGIKVGSPYLSDPINRVKQFQLMLHIQNLTLLPIVPRNGEIHEQMRRWIVNNSDNDELGTYGLGDLEIDDLFEGSDSSGTDILDSDSDEEEEDISENDQLRNLLAELPKLDNPYPKVGQEYTLDEFRALLPMKKKVVMGPVQNVDCGLNDNTAPKTEAVIVKVLRPRDSRLRLKYEWDRSGNTLYVFCADKLRTWLRTKVPDYRLLQDTNPFNNKTIYKVKYIDERQANKEWAIRKSEKKKEENILKMRQQDPANPMLQVFIDRIDKTKKELDMLADEDNLDYAHEDASMAADDAKRELKKLTEANDILHYSKLLQDKDKDRREGAKKILEALKKQILQKEEEAERFEARAKFLSDLFNDKKALEEEKERLRGRLGLFESQYEGLKKRLTPNTKTLNTKASTNNIIQRMAKLKF